MVVDKEITYFRTGTVNSVKLTFGLANALFAILGFTRTTHYYKVGQEVHNECKNIQEALDSFLLIQHDTRYSIEI